MMRALIFALFCIPIMFVSSACSQPDDDQEGMRGSSKTSQRGWLGVSTQDMTRRLARSMKVTTETGALVNNVVEDSPAEKAGIKEEDVIIEFDGKKIDDADDLMRAVRDKKPGASLSVVVMRGNEKKTLNATLGKLPHSERSYSFTIPPIAPHPRIRMFHGDGMLGMSLLELNDQLGDYFGAPEGRGVLVKSVKQNSKAGKAGFKAGDVIIKIGKETVDDVDDVYSALSDYNEGDKVECEIIRKGSRTTLSLEVPETQDLHGYYFNFGPHSGMMKEFDIDLDDLPGKELHDFEIDHHNFRHDMEILRRNLQEMGRTIRDNLMKLRSELRVSLKNVVGA